MIHQKSLVLSLLYMLSTTMPSVAQTCGTAFIVGAANSQPDLQNTIIPNGGSWLEPFKAPFTGSFCSFALNVYPASSGNSSPDPPRLHYLCISKTILKILIFPSSIAKDGFKGVKQINSSLTFRFTGAEYGTAPACDKPSTTANSASPRATPTPTPSVNPGTASKAPVSAPTVIAPSPVISSYYISTQTAKLDSTSSSKVSASPMPTSTKAVPPPPSPSAIVSTQKPSPTGAVLATTIVELNDPCVYNDFGCGENNTLLYCKEDVLIWDLLEPCEVGTVCQYVCPDHQVGADNCPGKPVDALCVGSV
ncbi:hypothetical protein BDR26DRAFT_919338 [Obelidium mucronatum]|nr:hypothetical protein BDR26DRAFT_919338 [Obelidium mucronatum]